jgi:hypothetical protein
VGYISLVNYKYDNGPHQLQGGPNHTDDNLLLTQKYLVVSSGYIDSLGNQVSWYGVNDVGNDYGRPVIGPPNSGAYVVDTWRAVPVPVSGFWSDYNYTYYSPSGELSIYNGFRGYTVQTIANAKVLTSYNPQYGFRNTGAYTYYGGDAPATQGYDPYNTPEGNTSTEGTTGGGVSHPRSMGTLLTTTSPSGAATGSRIFWEYNPPVYCQTFTESKYTNIPGFMGAPTRYMYRGKSSRYAFNLGSVYGVGGEGIRALPHRFSPSVNSSNQKSI